MRKPHVGYWAYHDTYLVRVENHSAYNKFCAIWYFCKGFGHVVQA